MAAEGVRTYNDFVAYVTARNSAGDRNFSFTASLNTVERLASSKYHNTVEGGRLYMLDAGAVPAAQQFRATHLGAGRRGFMGRQVAPQAKAAPKAR